MLYLELSRFGQLSVSGWALPWQPRASRDNCRARVHARSTQVWPSQSEREGAVTEHTSTRVAGLRVQTRLRTVRAVTAAAWPSPLKFSRLGQWQEPRGRMGGRGWEPLSDLDTDISQLWAHYVYHLTHPGSLSISQHPAAAAAVLFIPELDTALSDRSPLQWAPPPRETPIDTGSGKVILLPNFITYQ